MIGGYHRVKRADTTSFLNVWRPLRRRDAGDVARDVREKTVDIVAEK
jgi:hypothetical protein